MNTDLRRQTTSGLAGGAGPRRLAIGAALLLSAMAGAFAPAVAGPPLPPRLVVFEGFYRAT